MHQNIFRRPRSISWLFTQLRPVRMDFLYGQSFGEALGVEDRDGSSALP